MDDAMREACRFYTEHFAGMEALAPKKFSPEEQHALTMLAAYIRTRTASAGRYEPKASGLNASPLTNTEDNG